MKKIFKNAKSTRWSTVQYTGNNKIKVRFEDGICRDDVSIPKTFCAKFAGIPVMSDKEFKKKFKFVDKNTVYLGPADNCKCGCSCKNIILTKNTMASTDESVSHAAPNVLVLGSPGTGKTRFFLEPNVLQMDKSFAIVDPKGALLSSCGDTLYRNGYDIKILNMIDFAGETYDPLAYCKSETDAVALARSLVVGTSRNPSSDSFWDNAVTTVFTALIGFLTGRSDDGTPYVEIPEIMGNIELRPHMSAMVDMIHNMHCPAEGYPKDSQVGVLFDNLRAYEAKRQGCSPEDIEKPYCLKAWDNIKTTPQKTYETVITTASCEMDVFNLDTVRRFTNSNSVCLKDVPKKKTAVFFIMSQVSHTYDVLYSMAMFQLLNILTDFEKNEGEGSITATLPNGEPLAWFSKEDAAFLGREGIADLMSSLCIEEERPDSFRSLSDSEYMPDDDYYSYQNFKYCGYHGERCGGCYIIRTGDGRFITRCPSKKDAEALVEASKHVVLKENNPALPWHFSLLLDEFPNVGRIVDFKEKLATMRGCNTSCIIVCQSMAQLKDMYPDDYETLVALCSYVLFLGGDNLANAQLLTRLLNSHNQINKNDLSAVIQEDLARMSFRMALVIGPDGSAVVDEKYPLEDHPKYKQTSECYRRKFKI